MKRKTKNSLIGAVVGSLLGGVLFTAVGKTVMEFGIFVLTGIATIGAGFLVGIIALGKRYAVR